MEWIGYTTHHLAGNISILLLLLLFWWYNRIGIDDSKKNIIVMVVIVTAFVFVTTWAFHLRDNPNEIIKLF